MKFSELDKKIRVFETVNDQYIPPEMYIVARLDGRGFTKLTKNKNDFERPFDLRFRDYMVETTKHLMDVGFRVVYAYTQSDEISLLMHKDENGFGRKVRKFNSLLASEASAKFSLLLGDIATFDCRLSLLPTPNLVVDYFRWRNEDAHRNSLNAYCYWMLRDLDVSAKAATDQLSGMSVADKNELLFSKKNLNFNDVPNWQKRGTGIYWGTVEKIGVNPKSGEKVTALRNILQTNFDLPMKDAYSEFVTALLSS